MKKIMLSLMSISLMLPVSMSADSKPLLGPGGTMKKLKGKNGKVVMPKQVAQDVSAPGADDLIITNNLKVDAQVTVSSGVNGSTVKTTFIMKPGEKKSITKPQATYTGQEEGMGVLKHSMIEFTTSMGNGMLEVKEGNNRMSIDPSDLAGAASSVSKTSTAKPAKATTAKAAKYGKKKKGVAVIQ